MRLHFNANRAHIGNRFPFLPVPLLIIDRNSLRLPFPSLPTCLPLSSSDSASPSQYHINGFPARPASSRAFSAGRAIFRYIQFPRFVGFYLLPSPPPFSPAGEEEWESKKRSGASSSYVTAHAAGCCNRPHPADASFNEALGKTSSGDLEPRETQAKQLSEISTAGLAEISSLFSLLSLVA